MGKKTITTAITIFWLGMMSMLVHRTWRQRQQSSSQVGYASIIQTRSLNKQKQMGIYLGGKRIGMTRTTYLQKSPGFDIESFTRLQMSMLGDRPSSVRIKMSIGPDFRLRNIRGTLAIPIIETGALNLSGRVVDEHLHVKLTRSDGSSLGVTRIPFKGDEVLANIVSPFDIMPDLELGRTWSYQVFNPITQKFQEARAIVSRLDQLSVDKNTYDVFVVKITVNDLGASTAFITPEREIIKQRIDGLGLEVVIEPIGAEKDQEPEQQDPGPVFEDSDIAPAVPPEVFKD
ncbi:MAG: hypothetical protein QF473_30905 [Planctomycetota bacterium]|jgi:hypothetical protein|nr:hypothetical protein [Planctomycetota bacterium]